LALSVVNARNLIARSLRGSTDQDVRNDAMDALSMALNDLNTRVWEFSGITSTLTSSANVAQYPVGAGVLPYKIYSIVWNNSIPLTYISHREDDKFRPVKTNSTPTHYTINERLTQRHVVLMPTPSDAGLFFTVRGYDPITVATATAGNIDLPVEYRFWPVYQAKAMLLADRNGQQARSQFWQQKANRLWAEMVHADSNNPDQDVGFTSPPSSRKFPADHGWRGVEDAYGF